MRVGRKYPSDVAAKRQAKRSERQRWQDEVDEAEADALDRIERNRPYEDAMDADELVALARSIKRPDA